MIYWMRPDEVHEALLPVVGWVSVRAVRLQPDNVVCWQDDAGKPHAAPLTTWLAVR